LLLSLPGARILLLALGLFRHEVALGGFGVFSTFEALVAAARRNNSKA
jgi:hypothetical protein